MDFCRAKSGWKEKGSIRRFSHIWNGGTWEIPNAQESFSWLENRGRESEQNVAPKFAAKAGIANFVIFYPRLVPKGSFWERDAPNMKIRLDFPFPNPRGTPLWDFRFRSCGVRKMREKQQKQTLPTLPFSTPEPAPKGSFLSDQVLDVGIVVSLRRSNRTSLSRSTSS